MAIVSIIGITIGGLGVSYAIWIDVIRPVFFDKTSEIELELQRTRKELDIIENG